MCSHWLLGISWRLQCPHSFQKTCCLVKCPSRVFQSHRVSPIVGYQSQVFYFIERTTVLYCYAPGFDQMQTECGNQAAMGACNFGWNRRVDGKKSRSGGIKHCVIGSITGTVHIAAAEQKCGRCQSPIRLND